MTFRVGFLIIAAAKFLHLSFSQACLLLFGYFGFAALDQWLANRATEKVIDGEVSGWTPDADNSGFESKGDLSRMRLPQNEQIVVTRVAELLRKIH
jgi:hypothetical protein